MTRAGVVKIRRDIGREVRSAAEALEGRRFVWELLWEMDRDDPYPGESAWWSHDLEWQQQILAGGPTWIASGDIQFESDEP